MRRRQIRWIRHRQASRLPLRQNRATTAGTRPTPDRQVARVDSCQPLVDDEGELVVVSDDGAVP